MSILQGGKEQDWAGQVVGKEKISRWQGSPGLSPVGPTPAKPASAAAFPKLPSFLLPSSLQIWNLGLPASFSLPLLLSSLGSQSSIVTRCGLWGRSEQAENSL